MCNECKKQKCTDCFKLKKKKIDKKKGIEHGGPTNIACVCYDFQASVSNFEPLL